MEPGLVVDRYRVEHRIGAGAMGEVWLAVDDSLRRRVALKILAEHHRDNDELRARFLREARACAAISHPNVVQIFTTGEHDGRPYLAMEFLDGKDLGSLVREVGRLHSAEAASVVEQAARGLEAAARAGLIHRDVKPSNLLRLRDGTVKVTDFGLAKPVDAAVEPALTAMGVVVGTPDYIAPEQARGETIDARVDVYALGCTLFFLLTGRPPYRRSVDDGEKYLKVVTRHLRDPVPDARREAPGVDPELAALAMRMMAKNAADRPSYAEIQEVTSRVRARQAATERPVGASIGRPPGAKGTWSADATSGDWEPVRPRRSRWLVAVTAVSATIFFVGLGLVLFGPRGAPAARRASAPAAAPAAPQRSADPAPPAPPTPPAGMLVVPTTPDAYAFVAARPVTNREYAEVVRSHRYPKRQANLPVVGVPHAYALAYARARGGRLPTAEELDRAHALPGFSPAAPLWEWVAKSESEAEAGAGSQGPSPVWRGRESSTRPAVGRKDTTFRVVLDAARP